MSKTPTRKGVSSWAWWLLFGPLIGALVVAGAAEFGRAALAKPALQAMHTKSPNAGGPSSSAGPANCNFNGGVNSKNDCRTQKFYKISELGSNKGRLWPAGEKSPLLPCPIPEGSFGVLLGSNVSLSSGPVDIFTLDGDELLRLSNHDGRYLTIDTLKLFDDRQNIIADVRGASRYVVTNYAAWFDTPNKSTLVVYDHSDKPALSIHFTNKGLVSISGTFRSSKDNGSEVDVGIDKMVINTTYAKNVVLSGSCALGLAFLNL